MEPDLKFPWLSTPNKAFAALVLVSVWQLAGYMILIYVAGFMGLSEDVLEAASIDGASGWVKMKNIILPLMMSSVTICLFLTLSRAFMVYRCQPVLNRRCSVRNHRDGSHARI